MSISSLPTDVLKYIMGFLPTEELGRICSVSQLWNASASGIQYRIRELFSKRSFVAQVQLRNVNPCVDKKTYLSLREALREKVFNIDLAKGEKLTLNIPLELARQIYREKGWIECSDKDFVQIGGLPQKFKITGGDLRDAETKGSIKLTLEGE